MFNISDPAQMIQIIPKIGQLPRRLSLQHCFGKLPFSPLDDVVADCSSLYTFAVYVGSSLYTSSQPQVMKLFGVTHTEASLGLALYVLVT